MDEKILRETFDHNLNESFRLKQLENGLSVFTVIKTTQTNLVTKSMEKPLFAHIRVTSRCNLKCAYCYAEDETTSTDMTDESILSVVKMCHIHGILCITWTGGEPLIRDNFYDVISLAYNYGIKQTILTNGTLLERVHREKWPKDNINFQVSLNEVWIKFEEAKESIYNARKLIEWGYDVVLTIMLGTGCRIGEVLGLRWQDVDFKNRTISINHNLVYRVQEDGTCTNHVNSPKTKAGIRIIPMLDEVFDAFLEEYQYQKVIGFCTDEIDGYSGFVFCTGDGKVYLPNAINSTIRSICADYNKEEESKAKEENRDPVLLPKFSCHILRHTFCTRFCENETNLKVIQEIMGHADISTTMDVYAEATQEKKKESMTSLQSALLVR